ncbi:MAG: hypothetical protein P4L98_11585 [Ancalomicrobiaceae bacterium]|nr:hypothetical protein [Ancalomicrobiaceae bacterium]
MALYLVAWLTLSNLEIAKVVEDLPTGTPAKAVIERMEQRGFTCQRFNAPGFNLQLSISLTPFRYERWSYSIDCDRDEPATSTGWVGTSRVVARMNADGVEAATAETTWRPRSSK